jgi:hypothetical protein
MRMSPHDPSGRVCGEAAPVRKNNIDIYSEELALNPPGVAMALLLIAVVWMLLAAIVVGLCRAARLGESTAAPPPAQAVRRIELAQGSAAAPLHDPRLEASRRLGGARGQGEAGPFTKSSRRRAGLHRA